MKGLKSKRKKTIIIISIVAFVVVGGITAPLIYFFAPISRNTKELGQIDTGGFARGIDVVEDIAYVLDITDYTPGGLVIINVSDPTDPQELGSYYESGTMWEVDVEDNIAYIANYGSGLEVVNVSDPSNPIRIHHYASNQQIMDVQVEGDLAFVADWDRGFLILNVSDPSSVVELSQYPISGACIHTEIIGNRAYVVDHQNNYNSIIILDISDSNTISLLGEYTQVGVDFWDPILNGNYMYVGDHSEGPDQFFILDVSNPASVQEAGVYTKTGMTSFCIDGNYLFNADWDKGLEVYDISNPIDPKKVARFDDGGEAYDVVVVDGIAYLTDGPDGLEIIELQF